MRQSLKFILTKYKYSVLLFGLVSNFTYAQVDETPRTTPDTTSNINVITIRGAIDTAISNNPTILQAKEKLNQDRAATSLVRANLFPVVNATGTALRQKQSEATVSGNPNAVAFGGDPYNSYNLDVKLTQPLFAYGSLSAVRQADYDRQLNTVDVEIAERNLAQQVIQAFYSVILDQKLLDLLNRNLDVLQETLKTSQSRYQTGRGQLLDVLQVKTQIALLKPQIITAKNTIVTARQILQPSWAGSRKSRRNFAVGSFAFRLRLLTQMST